MSALRWLHLTDLHVGKEDAAQRAALNGLIAAVNDTIGATPCDIVFLTGDLAYSGTTADYSQLSSVLLAQLRSLPSLARARFVAIPGNHDLDCDATIPSPWASLGKPRQQVFFQNTTEGKRVRQSRSIGFRAYRDFCTANGIETFDPTETCSGLITIKNSPRIDVILLNTALFSDKLESDKGISPAPTLALRTHLSEIPEDAKVIVLGHHPISWFEHATREPFKALIYERCAIYLHGHEHKIEVETTQRGLLSVGFGAAYQAPLDDTAVSNYENGFAVCVLDDQLHIALRSWDNLHGVWRQVTKLPFAFELDSRVMPIAFCFDFPQKRIRRAHSQPLVILPERQRRAPVPEHVVCLETVPDRGAWVWLLKIINVLSPTLDINSIRSLSPTPGITDLVVNDDGSTTFIRCIPGPGHVLSGREVEAENTRMDAEAHQSLIIVTFGALADDARKLATQLERRKSLRTIIQSDIARLLNQVLPNVVQDYLDNLDAADANVHHVILAPHRYWMIEDRLRRAWFYIIDSLGKRLDETDEIVRKCRELSPSLSVARYLSSDVVSPETTSSVQYDKPTYLDSCHKEFEGLKYAGLATFGFRFPHASIRQVYVPASADVGEASASSTALRQVINDVLDTLQLDDAQRAQLESQLRQGLSSISLRETGAARSLYQQYGSILILGDPGSGKTCFLKNELLSYCLAISEDNSWYRYHTPVFVPLVEMIPFLSGNFDLVDVAAKLCARRSLPINAEQIRTLLADGKVALFLDGLDEVGSVEQRALIIEAIKEFLSVHGPLGNRFALTSRPAAVHALDVPKHLTTLHLRGLTDAEMRILASNVLAAEVAQAGEKLRLGSELNAKERELVERLLEDCRNNPGIRRIARNPLLLTLLVTIYANSGPLAAKRHRVYSQAVQTLVSVRNRESKQQVLSEADLRHRLGAVALQTYLTHIVEIPTLDWVASTIAQSLQRNPSDAFVLEQMKSYVRLIAEATGILVIHERTGAAGAATVTFMHHSFLEYYAAIGFLAQKPIADLPSYARYPRWREVISVIAGILADQSDATDLVKHLLEPSDDADRVTLDHVLFALDCASEADVPTEATQAALADSIRAGFQTGPLVIDPELRQDVCDRIVKLLIASGSEALRKLLHEGLSIRFDNDQLAAYVDMLGHIAAKYDVDDGVINAFSEIAQKVDDNSVRVAICAAIQRASSLRTHVSLQLLRDCLRGPTPVRFAAVRALDAVPALAKECWAQAKTCLEDSHSSISGLAARALMSAGIQVSPDDRAGRVLLETCLRNWAQIADPGESPTAPLQTSKDELDRALSSPLVEDRVLGLRLLPLLEREERYVYDRILSVLTQDKERGELVAALESLRLSRGAQNLMTHRDLELVGEHLLSPYRDVRIAVARALASHPTPDSRIIELLRSYAERAKLGEFKIAIRSLARIANDDPEVQEYLYGMCGERTERALRISFGDDAEQRQLATLLQVCEELGVMSTERLEQAFEQLVRSYRAPKLLRQRALRALARTARPSVQRAEFFVDLLNGNDIALGTLLGPAVIDYIRMSRQRVGHVKAIFGHLPALQSALIRRWHRISDAQPNGSRYKFNEERMRGIRVAVHDVRDVVVSYGELGTS